MKEGFFGETDPPDLEPLTEALFRLGPVELNDAMKILSAEFLLSAESLAGCPKLGLPEVAFAGRSNVGKSSLINTLLGRRNLVKTSKTPGHTRKLNFFLINESFVFVDMPGYGFARVPEEMRRKWGPMVETYLTGRRELRGLVLIVDVRHPLTAMDKDLAEFLDHHGTRAVIAATKADKLKKSAMMRQKKLVQADLDEDFPLVLFSSHDGLGKKELWKEIRNFMES